MHIYTQRALAVVAVAGLTLTGCSNADTKSDHLQIITSTPVWSDVARELIPEDAPVDITPIINDDSTDPHHFEPSAADMAKAKEADIVIVGGGGYDAWLTKNLDNPEVIHALPLDGNHDQNEHIWYDPESIHHVAHELVDALEKSNPSVKADMESLHTKIHASTDALSSVKSGRVAQTEPIADYLIAQTGMKDVTPQGYRQATMNENDPAAADLAAFLDLINSGGLDVLVVNPQTENDMTKRIVEAAEAKHIRTVEIPETPPSGTSFPDYLVQVSKALAG